jgi:hypothetical protein
MPEKIQSTSGRETSAGFFPTRFSTGTVNRSLAQSARSAGLAGRFAKSTPAADSGSPRRRRATANGAFASEALRRRTGLYWRLFAFSRVRQGIRAVRGCVGLLRVKRCDGGRFLLALICVLYGVAKDSGSPRRSRAGLDGACASAALRRRTGFYWRLFAFCPVRQGIRAVRDDAERGWLVRADRCDGARGFPLATIGVCGVVSRGGLLRCVDRNTLNSVHSPGSVVAAWRRRGAGFCERARFE